MINFAHLMIRIKYNTQMIDFHSQYNQTLIQTNYNQLSPTI